MLIAVAEAGGVTAAATRLGVSKGWVSKVITALEARLGARLVHRNTRALALTPAGEAFLERARGAVELLDEAEQGLRAEGVSPRGELRITLPVSFGVRYVAPLISAFVDKHPAVRVHAQLADHIVDVVAEGFDLAIRGGKLDDSELVARRVCSLALWTVASPAYLARRGEPRTPAELAAHDVLIYTLSRDGARLRYPGHEPVAVRGPLASNNGDALLVAAERGLGVLVQPDWMLADAVRAGRLVRLLPDVQPATASMWAVYPSSRHLSAKVSAFVDFVAAALDPPPWGAAR